MSLIYPLFSQDTLDAAGILVRVEKKIESGKMMRGGQGVLVLAHDQEIDAGHALDPENAGGIGQIQENLYRHLSLRLVL